MDCTPQEPLSPRVRRELRTVAAMLRLYCRRHHGARDLCLDCSQLWDYARARVESCPFCPDKPTCVQCPVHCYKASMRERIRGVMRFAGPRMLWHHPWLAILHLWDGRQDRRRQTAPRRVAAESDPGSHNPA